tara:strand:+ start:183 stop:434 length:252 start_codon:yes stop_codon:yes gene_type:complete
MGKKKSRASQTSKGQRRNVVAGLSDDRTELQKVNDKMKAHLKGKNVMLTIENPIKSETNKPFIRVPAKQEWRHTGKFIMKDRS